MSCRPVCVRRTPRDLQDRLDKPRRDRDKNASKSVCSEHMHQCVRGVVVSRRPLKAEGPGSNPGWPTFGPFSPAGACCRSKVRRSAEDKVLVQPWIRASPGCGIDVLWRALGTQGAPCPFFALLMRVGMSIFAFLPPAARASARAVINADPRHQGESGLVDRWLKTFGRWQNKNWQAPIAGRIKNQPQDHKSLKTTTRTTPVLVIRPSLYDY